MCDMRMTRDERLNELEPMWCDTSSSRQEKTTYGALLCSLVQNARVVIVRVIVDGVLGVIVDVHIGHDEVLVIYVAIFIVIFCNWRCTLYKRSTVFHILPTTPVQREGVGFEEVLNPSSPSSKLPNPKLVWSLGGIETKCVVQNLRPRVQECPTQQHRGAHQSWSAMPPPRGAEAFECRSRRHAKCPQAGQVLVIAHFDVFSGTLYAASREESVRGTSDGRLHTSLRQCGTLG